MLTALRTFRLVLLLVWTVGVLPLQLGSMFLQLPAARMIPMMYHRGVARVLRLNVEISGDLVGKSPILFAANHSSWIDIVVLSALAPVSFVAKAEIAGWPGINALAKLQHTIFIVRRRGKSNEGRAAIHDRLVNGGNVVLFAEGTAADGNHVLPFKSSMFAAADSAGGREPEVQPVSIAYTHLNQLPLGRRARHQVAWYGRMSLGKHIWSLLGQGGVRVAVTLHPGTRLSDFGSRKALAAHCHRLVAASHAEALSDSPPMSAPGSLITAQVS